MPRPRPRDGEDPWEYRLRKYLLLLATLVATVTYGAGFNPPGGVWSDPAAHLAGDPIIRETRYARYLAFFYSNGTAFTSSLVVIVLILILSVLHDKGTTGLVPLALRVLRGVMVVDLLSLMAAYAAGTFRDRLTAIYSSIFVVGAVAFLALHMALARRPDTTDGGGVAEDSAPKRLPKLPMLLATFAVSVTYLAGLSAPGGFWDHDEGGHHAGDVVLKGGSHDARLKAFFVCNTTAFVASLFIIVLLLDKKLFSSVMVPYFGVNGLEVYGLIVVTLAGLVAAYSAGSCRQVGTTIYVNALVCAVLVCILVQVIVVKYFANAITGIVELLMEKITRLPWLGVHMAARKETIFISVKIVAMAIAVMRTNKNKPWRRLALWFCCLPLLRRPSPTKQG